eukprot:CAMPEP_0184663602 /NCGR_PEP_ID=MMETSP0308-20130426/48838_1 /TAXON_ID=38269 /ORGANISM="Gloeochaete witrockiana, Strain SAG 46.84" /LENGTH=44 /DNA_ID= /DNA_START= /DNA_END= /DNA_ORIENTATION=
MNEYLYKSEAYRDSHMVLLMPQDPTEELVVLMRTNKYRRKVHYI